MASERVSVWVSSWGRKRRTLRQARRLISTISGMTTGRGFTRGEINSGPTGLLSFAESIDDSTQIKIDDVVVLQDQVWNVPTASGVLQFTPNTYHSIEIRMGNGVGEAGPVSVNNFVANTPTDPPTANGYGFGFSQTGATGTNGANYIKPIDTGNGSLFRHETAPATAAGQDINVLGELDGHAAEDDERSHYRKQHQLSPRREMR